MPAKAAPSSIHAILGTDEGLVKEAALELSKKLAPPDNEFGLEIVNGAADNADMAAQVIGRTIEAIQTLPFFGGDKVVWLQGVNFLADTQTGKAESTLAAVEAFADYLEKGIPPDVTLIISAGDVDKRRSFYKRLTKLAKVVVHDRLEMAREGWEAAVMKHTADRARDMNLKFADGALERFIQRVGSDTRLIDSELGKLSIYTGNRAVTEEDVMALTAQNRPGFIFDIGDAIGRRDLAATLRLIDFQLNRGENAIGLLLAAIVPKVRRLLQFKDLIDNHGVSIRGSYNNFVIELDRLPASATDHLPRTKEGKFSLYYAYNEAPQTRHFTLAELKDALAACLEANHRLVQTSLEPRLVLHQLAARILVAKNESAPAKR